MTARRAGALSELRSEWFQRGAMLFINCFSSGGARVPPDAGSRQTLWHHASAISTVRADVRIVDSWIDEIHDSGADSQAILGYDGPGPYLIENNELQASLEGPTQATLTCSPRVSSFDVTTSQSIEM
jgi:hypothetical protein